MYLVSQNNKIKNHPISTSLCHLFLLFALNFDFLKHFLISNILNTDIIQDHLHPLPQRSFLPLNRLPAPILNLTPLHDHKQILPQLIKIKETFRCKTNDTLQENMQVLRYD